jgi:DNA-binding NarL/FixJ family response regulator
MDIRMPVLDGQAATERVVAARHGRVLVLTTFDADENVYAALKAGASGFILKDGRPEGLVAAVHPVAAGDALLAPAITRRVIERYLDGPAPGTPAPAAMEVLTGRETEVLRALATGWDTAEIAALLFLGEATVNTHITRVLAKLGLRDRLQAVVYAHESGLVRPGGAPAGA